MSGTSAHYREVLAYVAVIGGTEAYIEEQPHGNHPRVRFIFDGRQHAVVIGSTPSDANAIWLARRYIRRTIGLERIRVVGTRRRGRLRVERPLRLVQLAAPLPDWRDALRRHPLYLALAAEDA